VYVQCVHVRGGTNNDGGDGIDDGNGDDVGDGDGDMVMRW